MAFADGDILSASQLNALVGRVNALEDQRVGVNLGFAQVTLNANDAYYQVVHTYDWLHLRYYLQNNDTGITVYYDATEVYAPAADDGDHVVNVDLSGFGLVVGQLYRVRVAWREEDSSGGDAVVHYMVEAEAAL